MRCETEKPAIDEQQIFLFSVTDHRRDYLPGDVLVVARPCLGQRDLFRAKKILSMT